MEKCPHCQRELTQVFVSNEIPGVHNTHYVICTCSNVMLGELDKDGQIVSVEQTPADITVASTRLMIAQCCELFEVPHLGIVPKEKFFKDFTPKQEERSCECCNNALCDEDCESFKNLDSLETIALRQLSCPECGNEALVPVITDEIVEAIEVLLDPKIQKALKSIIAIRQLEKIIYSEEEEYEIEKVIPLNAHKKEKETAKKPPFGK
jgi:uncharacterized protein (UPF0212 family)